MIRYALPIWAFCVLLSCSPTPSERGEGPKAELPVPFEIQSGIWERQPGWAEPRGEEGSEPGLRQTAEPARLVIETPEQASKRIAEHVQKQGPSGRGWEDSLTRLPRKPMSLWGV